MTKRSNILVINNIRLPTPSSMQHGLFDLSVPNRNANGKMIIQYIRRDIHKIECSWNLLRPDEYMIIQKAIEAASGLSTYYFIPDLEQEGTIETYRGDRTIPVYTYENGKPVYKGFKCNFIEM